jgi:hypothetical protein
MGKSTQLDFFNETNESQPKGNKEWLQSYLAESELAGHDCGYEDWVIKESSAELSYLTHGFFRYFGKFPPPVARRFIEELHQPQFGPVVDPMCGSGTTLVEAVIRQRAAVGLDVNPLSCLTAKVKTTPVDPNHIKHELERYTNYYSKQDSSTAKKYIPEDPHLDHWFYTDTQLGIAKTRQFIEEEMADEDVRDLFKVSLASVIRRLSRASNGLGRMFLDPAIQPMNAEEPFIKKCLQLAKGMEQLTHFQPDIVVKQHEARLPFLAPASTNLVICHPPYFNVYRYSSLYKFEMLWLGFDYSATRKQEVREGFKLGKLELLNSYIDDMAAIFINIHRTLISDGWCVLMIGDTYLRGERINTTARVLERVLQTGGQFHLNKIIIRHPKYTEASYAAGQRRTGKDIGVKLPDHIIVMRKGV